MSPQPGDEAGTQSGGIVKMSSFNKTCPHKTRGGIREQQLPPPPSLREYLLLIDVPTNPHTEVEPGRSEFIGASPNVGWSDTNCSR